MINSSIRLAKIAWPNFFSWLIILLLPAVAIGLAYFQALYFDAYPYDGPFQHLYPLREMEKGYMPGVDFNFFHGTAIPYINYGIYKLAGGGVFGALFSAKLTQLFSVYFGLLFLCSRMFSMNTRHIVFFVLMGVMASETYFIGLAPLWDVSSFGIRTLAGLIIAGVLVRNMKNRFFSMMVLVAICVIGVLLGTEHGFYCAAAVCLVIVITKYFHDSWQRIAYAGSFFFLFLASLFIVVYLLFGSFDSLLFIKNVANDQVWYYGAPPVLFVRSVTEIFSNAHWSYLPKIILASIFVFALTIYAERRGVISKGQFRGVLFLMLWGWMGLTSDFSIVAYHYSEPLLRSMLIAVFLIFVSYLENTHGNAVARV